MAWVTAGTAKDAAMRLRSIAYHSSTAGNTRARWVGFAGYSIYGGSNPSLRSVNPTATLASFGKPLTPTTPDVIELRIVGSTLSVEHINAGVTFAEVTSSTFDREGTWSYDDTYWELVSFEVLDTAPTKDATGIQNVASVVSNNNAARLGGLRSIGAVAQMSESTASGEVVKSGGVLGVAGSDVSSIEAHGLASLIGGYREVSGSTEVRSESLNDVVITPPRLAEGSLEEALSLLSVEAALVHFAPRPKQVPTSYTGSSFVASTGLTSPQTAISGDTLQSKAAGTSPQTVSLLVER